MSEPYTSQLHSMLDPLIREGVKVETEKQVQALTEDEAKKLKALGFLRQIAPYLFDSSKGGHGRSH